MTYDSLILNFTEVPEDLRQNRIIEAPPRISGGTLIQIRNGIFPNASIEVSYSLYQGDSLLESGQSDLFGNIHLDSGLTNVKLSLLGFDPDSKDITRIYGVQELKLEHTNARSILVMLTYKPVNVAYIEVGQLRLKSRLTQNGKRLKLMIKSGNFFHPGPGTISYIRSE